MTLAAALLAAALSATQTTAPAPAATPAPAQTAPAPATPTVGAVVYDGAGVQVGTIVAITGDAAVIDTGTSKAGYPVASIGAGAKGLTIALTKAQLDASAVEQQAKAAAELNAKLVAGTTVRSRNGTASVGTIKTADASFVTLTTVKGDIKFPRAGFSLDPQGVIIGFTADEFNAAIGVK